MGLTNVYRCGHIPGAVRHSAYNSGLVVLKNRPAVLDILHAWYKILMIPSK